MRRALVVAAFAALPGGLWGQEVSPAADLMGRARQALDNLRYAEADSLARIVLGMGQRLSAEQRLSALQLVAAAQFPEPVAGAAQHPDSALVYLRQIVRAAPNAALRPEMSWRGLDSLMLVARRTTFVASVQVLPETVTVGRAGDVPIEVHATRAGRFRLALKPQAGGSAVYTDSAGPAERSTLKLHFELAGVRPSIPSGSYTLEVTAAGAETPDTMQWRYAVEVNAPPLSLTSIPVALESTRLKPEVAPPARSLGLGAGLFVGGATVAIANLLRGPEPLKSGVSADSRAYIAGGILAAGAVVAGLADRGHPLPQNAAQNAQIRRDFAESVRQAET